MFNLEKNCMFATTRLDLSSGQVLIRFLSFSHNSEENWIQKKSLWNLFENTLRKTLNYVSYAAVRHIFEAITFPRGGRNWYADLPVVSWLPGTEQMSLCPHCFSSDLTTPGSFPRKGFLIRALLYRRQKSGQTYQLLSAEGFTLNFDFPDALFCNPG